MRQRNDLTFKLTFVDAALMAIGDYLIYVQKEMSHSLGWIILLKRT